MSKEAKARLRELAPAVRGSQDTGSRNLAIAFFDRSVGKRLILIVESRL